MKKVKLAKHDIEMYDSIESLPISRFHKFNKYLLVDAGIGSDIADFDSHIEKAIRFSRTKPDKTIDELENLRQNVFMIQNELSPKHMAFCVMVCKIDGIECDDLSEEGIKKVMSVILDANASDVSEATEEIKKKLDLELSEYFPSVFDDSTAKEYFDQLRKRTIAILDEIIDGVDKKDEIEELTNLLMTFSNPLKFAGKDSIEIEYDKNFENMCIMLSQKLHINPKNYTVLEFYNAYEYLKKQIKQESKAHKK